MNRILSIDTSSRFASLCLYQDEAIQAEYNFKVETELSASLIPSLHMLLNNLGLTVHDIDLFAICIGPGIFTGLRVGLATLKGITFSMKKPIVPLSSLQALAHHFIPHPDPVIPMIDARRGEVYLAGYRSDAKNLQEYLSPALVPIEEVESRLQREGRYLFVGSGALVHKAQLLSVFPTSTVYPGPPFIAREMAQLSLLKFRENQYTIDPQEIRPLYIRKPDAEAKQTKKKTK